MKPTKHSIARHKANEHVTNVLLEKLDVMIDDIKLGSKLVNDFYIDSLDYIEIVMSIEKSLNIDMPNDELENVITVKNLTDIVVRELLKQN